MKKIEIVLEGNGQGLLMHSAQGMVAQTAKKNPAKNYVPEEDAEAVAYRNKDGKLYIPSRCMKSCMLNAASWYKFGKNSAKQIIAGGTRIEESEILLLDEKGKTIEKYELDIRPVVVQRARIMRARPRIDKWTAKFTLIYNENMLGTALDTIREIIEESGQRIGLLDNRPQKYGENGTFVVTKFLPKK